MIKGCPNKKCTFHGSNKQIIKSGRFYRRCDSKYVQRFRCKHCGANFSHATGKMEHRHRKRREVPLVRHLLCSGVSIRRIAKILKIHRTTVNRKIILLSARSLINIQKLHCAYEIRPVQNLQFDDLITIEHTKLKPLSVSIAIDKDSRRFLASTISRIPAFGHLAERSRKKYGKRPSEHKKGLSQLFNQLDKVVCPHAIIESDEHSFYPEFVNRHFPNSNYRQYKGGRGCIAGQGELKKKHFDPLFTLNHNFAMLRANINRLIRKTWCTTKDPEMLKHHLNIYMDYHNSELV